MLIITSNITKYKSKSLFWRTFFNFYEIGPIFWKELKHIKDISSKIIIKSGKHQIKLYIYKIFRFDSSFQFHYVIHLLIQLSMQESEYIQILNVWMLLFQLSKFECILILAWMNCIDNSKHSLAYSS